MGRKNAVIGLITTTYDDNTDKYVDSDPREVLAEEKSIRQSEFYQAQGTGLRPELTFVVWTDEYNDEQKLTHKDKEYNIIRTFDKDEKETELICSGLVNKGA